MGVLSEIVYPSICRAVYFNLQEKIASVFEGCDDEDTEEDEFDERKKTTVVLYLEYIPFKLKDLLKSEVMISTLKTKIAVEVAFGMLHLHARGIIHRDLKIENIILNYYLEAKIIDFDLVHVTDNEEMSRTLTKWIGTLDHMSPEMLNNEEYTNKTDIYSYGIVLFVLFTGSLPNQCMKDTMLKKPISLPRPSSLISKLCINIIRMCTM